MAEMAEMAVCWAVQEEERLDLTMAAPSTQHLLSEDA